VRTVKLVGAALAAVVLMAACDPFEEDLGPAPASNASSGGARAAVQGPESIQRNAETISRALTLLSENYVEGAELSQLLGASQRSAWQALAEAGVPPVDVDAPPRNGVLTDTMQSFRQRYVRTATKYSSKVEPGWLAHEMIRGAANSLDDCHTGFLTPQQVQEQVQRLSGTTRFGGIGVLLRRLTDKSQNQFTIVEVFQNSPAEKAGVRPGDLIVAVDGSELNGLGIEQVVGMVRGAEGTPTRLTIQRTGVENPFVVELTRAQVAAPVLRAAVLDGNIGYVKLYGFPEPMVGQLDNALKELERQRVGALVIDLRDNAGGQLDVVTKVTSRFIASGPLFQGVSQTGERTMFYADGNYWLKGRPVVVLVNGGTGSGGEILASAIKEHRVGRLVGTKTSGCVSTGQMFPLPDNSAIEIATNRVVSGIRGAELNKVGVGPDVTAEASPADLANGSDIQLIRAVETLLRG
jgi:carboxyl-terminal processing protease